jgi:hypothetical protein
MKLLYLIVVLFISFSSFASTDYVLKGTIGKSEIYMKFTDYTKDYPKEKPTIVNIRYFYKSYLRDVILNGVRHGNQFMFQFQTMDSTAFEKFSLTLFPNGEFKGLWENGGKKLEVKLAPVQTETVTHPFQDNSYIQKLKKRDPYEYMRSSFLVFKNDSISTYKDKHFQWVSENHSGAFGFFPGDDFDATIKTNLYAPLEALLLERAIDRLGCANEWEYSTGNSYDHRIEITFLNANLLGMSVFTEYSCGGPHPDYSTMGYLFELSTGKSFDIDEIIAFDSSVIVYSEENFSAHMDYRGAYFAPGLLKLFKQIKKAPVSEDDEQPEVCYDPAFWESVDWIYYEDGIKFSTTSYISRYCDSPLVPFSLLKKYKNPTFPYRF